MALPTTQEDRLHIASQLDSIADLLLQKSALDSTISTIAQDLKDAYEISTAEVKKRGALRYQELYRNEAYQAAKELAAKIYKENEELFNE